MPDYDRYEEVDVDKLRHQIEMGAAHVTKDYVRSQINELRQLHDSSVLNSNADFLMIERWCHTQEPLPTTVTEEAIDSIAERCCSSHEDIVRRKKRLRSQFAVVGEDPKSAFHTNSGRRRCQHCVHNNVCMAEGCNLRPLDLVYKRQGFRCLFDIHLCNKHGLCVNVNNKRHETVTLKDGRVLGNLFAQASFPDRRSQKRQRTAKWPPKASVMHKDLQTAMMVVNFLDDYKLHDYKLSETLKAIAESTDADE